MKRSTLVTFLGLAGLAASPAAGQSLGLDLATFIGRLDVTSKELACMENPKPGDDSQIIVSCTHSLGDGRLLISNSQPDGPLIDIATQPWTASDGSAANMVASIAAALGGGQASTFIEPSRKLVDGALADGSAGGEIGPAAFYLLDFGGKITITTQAR